MRSFSIASSNSEIRYTIPEGPEVTSLPGFCKSPLLHSCFRAQNKNDTEFYSPAVDTRDAFLLERVIQHGDEISLRKNVVSFRCNPNDFVISSGKLLVACRPIGSNDTCTYLHDNQCHNFPPPNDIENLVADPVAFAVPNMEDSSGGRILSVVRSRSGGLKLIVFLTSHQLRPYDVPDDCQAPLKLSRQESTVLLACANGTRYMVNVTELPAKFFHINSAAHGSLLALSNKGYALFSSLLQLTLQNITSGDAITKSINDIQDGIIYADFSSDGNHAFVVTNVTVIFIHVTDALQSQAGFYIFDTQICFICPSVQFINSTTAVISTRDGDKHVTFLLFLALNHWPPYLFLNKTLPGFPKQYWFIADSAAETVLPTTIDNMTSPNTAISTGATATSEGTKPITTSNPSNSDDPDNGIILILVLIIITCFVIFTIIVTIVIFCKNIQKRTTNSGAAPTVEPVPEQNRPDRYIPIVCDNPPIPRHRYINIIINDCKH